MAFQMILEFEELATRLAPERPLAKVHRVDVPRQSAALSKRLAAAGVGADVRPLARVRPLVGSQILLQCKRLAAIVAHVVAIVRVF